MAGNQKMGCSTDDRKAQARQLMVALWYVRRNEVFLQGVKLMKVGNEAHQLLSPHSN